MKRFEKIILTDCDGVLLNWEQGFHHWMIRHGYEMQGDWDLTYDIAEKYGLDMDEKKHLVKMFNENADIMNSKFFSFACSFKPNHWSKENSILSQ